MTDKPEISLQEIFDRVADHLNKQGKASAIFKSNTEYEGDPQSYCQYRHPDPDQPGVILMCAAGCLMDPAKYTPDMEDCCSNHPLVEDAFPFKVDLRRRDLITELQCAHDECLADDPYLADLSLWRLRMGAVAVNFHLNPTRIHP